MKNYCARFEGVWSFPQFHNRGPVSLMRYFRVMGQVSVLLPEALVREARLDQGDVSLETAKFVALELFREQKVSIGRAAELCGVALAEFQEYARQHEVPIFYYGSEQEAEDRRALAKLGL
jgi:predicted HTH domain antitoxin